MVDICTVESPRRQTGTGILFQTHTITVTYTGLPEVDTGSVLIRYPEGLSPGCLTIPGSPLTLSVDASLRRVLRIHDGRSSIVKDHIVINRSLHDQQNTKPFNQHQHSLPTNATHKFVCNEKKQHKPSESANIGFFFKFPLIPK